MYNGNSFIPGFIRFSETLTIGMVRILRTANSLVTEDRMRIEEINIPGCSGSTARETTRHPFWTNPETALTIK